MTITLQRLSYPAIFHPESDGSFGVTFPDFPGCATFGRTFEEAEKMAVEVLELWLEELAERHQAIPRHVRRPLVGDISVNTPRKSKLIYEAA